MTTQEWITGIDRMMKDLYAEQDRKMAQKDADIAHLQAKLDEAMDGWKKSMDSHRETLKMWEAFHPTNGDGT